MTLEIKFVNDESLELDDVFSKSSTNIPVRKLDDQGILMKF